MQAGEQADYAAKDPLLQLEKTGKFDMEQLKKNAEKTVASAFEKAGQSKELSLAEFEKRCEGAWAIET